jgi:hypothetical protein
MKNKRLIKQAIISTIVSVMLVGCGGGGSPSSGDVETSINQVDTISGLSVDGYLKFSTVCLDLNLDGFCAPTEPFTLTDENGAFTLSVSKEQQSDANYKKAQLIVYGGQDSDRPGQDFIGKLKAPNDGSGTVNITPITTLISAYIEQNNEAEVSVEDIVSAKEKVATIFGIDKSKIDADPRANGGDQDLMNATLQLQYAVTNMVEATKKDATITGDDAKDEKIAGDIFVAFASGLNNVTNTGTISDAINDIIDKAPAEKLNANAIKAKEVVKSSAKNINTVFTSSSFDISDAEKLNDTLTKVVVMQDKSIKAIKDANFTKTEVFNTSKLDEIKFEASEIEIFDFETEAKKIYLEDVGVDTDGLDVSSMDISFDKDLDELKTAMEGNSAILEKIQDRKTTLENKKKEINDKIAKADGDKKVASLKEDYEALEQLTKIATVEDAKNLFSQLRETTISFMDTDIDHQEDNTSTIFGAQASLITNKIKPSVDDIADDFNATVTEMESSMKEFDKDLKENFEVVLNTIENRIDAIKAAIDTYETTQKSLNQNFNLDTSNWEVNTSTDTLSYTYSKTGDIETKTMTLNGVTITERLNTKDDVLNSIATSGTITLQGTGYDLKVTSLSFANNKASFKASGKIIGANSSSMELTSLNITFDFDEAKKGKSLHAFDKLEFVLDGNVISLGRTFNGQMIVSEGNKQIKYVGKYTGAEDEPSFEGSVIYNISLDSIKTIDDQWEDDYWSAGAYYNDNILMVTYPDGNKSLVVSYDMTSKSNSNDINKTYTLYTQNDKNITCNSYVTWDDSKATNKVTCTGGTVKSYYGEDKVITAVLEDNSSVVIKGSWIGYTYNNHHKLNFEFKDKHIDLDNTIISDIKIKDIKTLDDFDAEIKLIGTITHSDKKVTATVGTSHSANSNTRVLFAKNIVATDGKSLVKASEIKLIEDKKVMQGDDNSCYNFGHGNAYTSKYSSFENYTVNFNHSEDDTFGTISVKDIELSIIDADNKKLTFDADFSTSKQENLDVAFAFNGTYTYANTKFVGIVDVKGNDESEIGSFNVSGKVESNGFKPFGIVVAGANGSTTHSGYAMFTRDNTYKLGFKFDGNETVSNVKMVDTNGVLANIKLLESDNSSREYNITNRNDDSLANFGKADTGNNWEIKYSDNTTESIF